MSKAVMRVSSRPGFVRPRIGLLFLADKTWWKAGVSDAKAGEMTFLNSTPEYGKLKACAFRGRALGGPRLMEGYSRMLVEPEGPGGAPAKRLKALHRAVLAAPRPRVSATMGGDLKPRRDTKWC